MHIRLLSGLAKIKCSCVKNEKLFQMLLKVKETVVDLNIYMQTKTKTSVTSFLIVHAGLKN